VEKDVVKQIIYGLCSGDPNLQLLLIWSTRENSTSLGLLKNGQTREAEEILLNGVNGACRTDLKGPDLKGCREYLLTRPETRKALAIKADKLRKIVNKK